MSNRRRSAQTVTIETDREDQKYYAIVPHIVWVLSRTPYDLMLWYVVKMIAGEQGECRLDTRELSRAAGMSVGKVADCRNYLIERELLTGGVEEGDHGHPTWRLRIPDLWPRNIAWRSQIGDGLMARIRAREDQHCSPGEQYRSPHEQNCSPGEQYRSPHEQNCSPGEQSQRGLHSVNNHKEQPTRITNKDDDARARGNGSSSSFQTWDDLIGFYGQTEVTEAVRVADGKGKGADFRYVCGILRIRAQRGAAPAARRGNGRRDPYAWEPVREVVTSTDDWEMVGED